MKQCPTCRTTYTDETLRYCLADGASLIDVGTEAETVVRPGVRVDIPSQQYPTIPNTVPATSKGSPVLKIVIALLILGFLGLLGLGAAGAIFYYNSGGINIAAASPTPTPTAAPTRSPSPTPSPDEDDQLEQEIANLQKQLEDALKPSPTPTSGSRNDGRPTARVNSPSDGFLALRSEPDSEHGERIAQIPHGAIVYLENCEKEQVKIGSRLGRWCMVTYQGQEGWVFNAWLDYQ